MAQEMAQVPLHVSPAGSPLLLALPSPLWWEEEKGALVRLKNSGHLLLGGEPKEARDRGTGLKSWVGGVHLPLH